MRAKIGRMSRAKLIVAGVELVRRDEHRAGRVVERDEAGCHPRPVIGRRDERPGRIGLDRAAADADGRVHWSVAAVVRPAVVPGERREWMVPERVGPPGAGEEDEPAVPVGHQLARGRRRRRGTSRAAETGRAPAPRTLRSPGKTTSRLRFATFSLREPRRRGIGEVERDGEVVPGSLRVRDGHAPGDIRLRRGQLADGTAVGVEAVDAEARRLLGDGAVAVLEPDLRVRQRPGHLGTEEEGVGAVADARDADRRVNRSADDPAVGCHSHSRPPMEVASSPAAAALRSRNSRRVVRPGGGHRGEPTGRPGRRPRSGARRTVGSRPEASAKSRR